MSEYYSDKHKYDDIINLEYKKPDNRPHMSNGDRAAQFAPFAALSGHKEAIEETARLSEYKEEIEETDRLSEYKEDIE